MEREKWEMNDEIYMRRCLQLAENGRLHTAPNPMVGAVVVCDGRIIGEGYHVRCGEAHAEVNAIRSVGDPSLLRRSTLYVSLEPCSHYGKTPPCADLIVEKQIPRIVIGCEDPFPEVAGRGIRRLREAGYEVRVGVLEAECRKLNRRFITFHTLHRPYITLKWAESADGFMDVRRTGGTPVVFSTPLTQMLVHKRRAEHSAILVGTRTAALDNPSLTVRHWAGSSPVRIVADRRLTLPSTLHLFDGTVPTLVFTELEHESRHNVEYVTIPSADSSFLPYILDTLYTRRLQSLLVEGGSQTLQSLLAANLWDEIIVEQSPVLLHDGIPSPTIPPEHPYILTSLFGRTFRHYETKRI